MTTALLRALGLAVALCPGALHAQTPAPATTVPTVPEASLTLELNKAADTAAGGCQVTFVTTNRMAQGLGRAAWQVAVFDAEGVVQSLPVLDFGALIAGKTKVAVFELPGRGCDSIARIVVNDVAECRAEDGTDLAGPCLSGLATRALGRIDFGI